MDEAAATEPPFEDALRQLERIVDDLERGEPELSTALAKYEEGVRLLARCQGVLDRAERSVALLTGVDESGSPRTAFFDPDSADRENPLTTPSPPKPGRRKRPPAAPAEGDDRDGLIPF